MLLPAGHDCQFGDVPRCSVGKGHPVHEFPESGLLAKGVEPETPPEPDQSNIAFCIGSFEPVQRLFVISQTQIDEGKRNGRYIF